MPFLAFIPSQPPPPHPKLWKNTPKVVKNYFFLSNFPLELRDCHLNTKRNAHRMICTYSLGERGGWRDENYRDRIWRDGRLRNECFKRRDGEEIRERELTGEQVFFCSIKNKENFLVSRLMLTIEFAEGIFKFSNDFFWFSSSFEFFIFKKFQIFVKYNAPS